MPDGRFSIPRQPVYVLEESDQGLIWIHRKELFPRSLNEGYLENRDNLEGLPLSLFLAEPQCIISRGTSSLQVPLTWGSLSTSFFLTSHLPNNILLTYVDFQSSPERKCGQRNMPPTTFPYIASGLNMCNHIQEILQGWMGTYSYFPQYALSSVSDRTAVRHSIYPSIPGYTTLLMVLFQWLLHCWPLVLPFSNRYAFRFS